jgi:hypothetical protein
VTTLRLVKGYCGSHGTVQGTAPMDGYDA